MLRKELQFLQNAVLDNPNRPLGVILGGAKVSTKLPVLESLLKRCDFVIVGGGIAFRLIEIMGGRVGSTLVSLVE